MYKLGRRSRHHKLLIGAFLMLFVLFSSYGSYKLLNLKTAPRETISNTAPTVQHYSATTTNKMHVDQPLFTANLPYGWKFISHQTAPYNVYNYQSPTPGTQLLSVYIDTLPLTMAVNRVLSVQAQGDQIGHDTVSDNCVNFLTPSALNTPQAQTQKVVDARWQSVEFNCDVGNVVRDVVGTSSSGAINKVILTGSTVGPHALFFTFTDNNGTPDYTVFYGILDSFKLK